MKIDLPLTAEMIQSLIVGNLYYLSGVIFSARDASHKKIFELIQQGEKLPFALKEQVIYYMGPTPARPGQVAGSAGPTTSGRMDKYTPLLLENGLKAMIGKGKRSSEVISAIQRHKAVYFATIGGAGAYLSKCIKSMEVVAFAELGAEAVYKLVVKDFPVIVEKK